MGVMIHDFLSDKHAISPILGDVLLMVVAVVAMSIAATTTYVVTSNLRETISERLVIEDVWFSGQGQINVYVRNVGRAAVEISRIYVNNTVVYFTPKSLGLGDHNWINISYEWASGGIYHIKIITSRGNHIDGYYLAP
ncbi:MAG: hypothetical protein QXT06_04785 [Candidatus Bathyarchaeia archaeon]|nr:hypothetical protein [Candidatus Bathyarchaeota archaeon]